MLMTDASLYDIGTYVCDLFAANNRPFLLYHNAAHTTDVVLHAIEIGAFYKLSDTDNFMLLAAAWFHDTGHLFADIATHEQESVRLMRAYFAENPIPAANIEIIAGCIMATKLPARPQTLLQQIICDADTYHLGSEAFWEMDPLVKAEMEARFGKPIEHWKEKTYAFLQSHQFFTTYAQEKLAPVKEEHMRILQR